jgi:leucyl/phenylalanyl-tRNA--protein transferase
MQTSTPALPWLEPGESFPPLQQAWGTQSPAPGLLAAGADLEPDTLIRAYASGIFPWFSEGQPILWWSPQPRMSLHVAEFRLHKSLKKVIRRFCQTPGSEIRVNTAFAAVIRACAQTERQGQNGTWILPDMQEAYLRLHRAGWAHSVETWQDGTLTGGLYFVAIGKAVFGESMFAWRTDASKLALSALVAMARHRQVAWIDCQQVTAHLAFMGARPIDLPTFQRNLERAVPERPQNWDFQPLYWQHLGLARNATP